MLGVEQVRVWVRQSVKVIDDDVGDGATVEVSQLDAHANCHTDELCHGRQTGNFAQQEVEGGTLGHVCNQVSSQTNSGKAGREARRKRPKRSTHQAPERGRVTKGRGQSERGEAKTRSDASRYKENSPAEHRTLQRSDEEEEDEEEEGLTSCNQQVSRGEGRGEKERKERKEKGEREERGERRESYCVRVVRAPGTVVAEKGCINEDTEKEGWRRENQLQSAQRWFAQERERGAGGNRASRFLHGVTPLTLCGGWH